MILFLVGCNTQELETQIADLKNEVEEKDETIEELRTMVEDKNAEIKELEASTASADLEEELALAYEEIDFLNAELESAYSGSISYENVSNEIAQDIAVEVTITDFYADEYADAVVEGELYNGSEYSLELVELLATFTDVDGNVIDSTTTFADADILVPDGRTKFYAYVTDDVRIEEVTVEVIDYYIYE